MAEFCAVWAHRPPINDLYEMGQNLPVSKRYLGLCCEGHFALLQCGLPDGIQEKDGLLPKRTVFRHRALVLVQTGNILLHPHVPLSFGTLFHLYGKKGIQMLSSLTGEGAFLMADMYRRTFLFASLSKPLFLTEQAGALFVSTFPVSANSHPQQAGCLRFIKNQKHG